MARINKAAIIANANRSSKGCCCCARDPIFAPGLRVELVRDVKNTPVSMEELQRFMLGPIEDIGVSRGPIGMIDRGLESAANGEDKETRRLWLAAFPGLDRSGAFDDIRTRSEAEGGGTFALRLTGQMFFRSEKDTVNVVTDDGLAFRVNGADVLITTNLGGRQDGQVNALAGWNQVEIVWWNRDVEKRVGGIILALLDGASDAVDPRRFRHAVQN